MLPKIEEFISKMQSHIEAKEPEYYGPWETLNIEDLVEHFREEVEELLELIEQDCPKCRSRLFTDEEIDYTDVQHEAIDVANMAYMIWYIATLKGESDATDR